MDQSNSKHGLAVVLAVVGLVVGAAIAYPIGNNMGKDNASESSSMSDTSSMSADTDGTTVGGAKMVRTKDIVDNAANAKNVTSVVAAVKAAGLVDALKAEGPMTVFAPDNGAFEKLPAGTVDTLLKPENKATLAGILTYHVVPGTYTAADLKAMANKGESLTSLQGGTFTPVVEDGTVKLKDGKGNMINIVTADIISSNGVTHVIDSVMMQ